MHISSCLCITANFHDLHLSGGPPVEHSGLHSTIHDSHCAVETGAAQAQEDAVEDADPFGIGGVAVDAGAILVVSCYQLLYSFCLFAL